MSILFRTCLLFALGVVMSVALAADGPQPRYPGTPVEPVTEKLHGVEITDPYRWLEDSESPRVKEWVDKQNAYTRAVLDPLPGRDKIHQRLGKLLEIGRISAATPAEGRYFYTKRQGTQNQAILYVRDEIDGKDRVLIDPNQLSAEGIIALDWWFPSRDGRLLAYGLSKNGSEESTLYVKDVTTGKDLPDQIERTRHASVSWLPDGKSFFYSRYPAAGSVAKGDENYFRHIYYHELGSDPAKDMKVFGEGRKKEDWPGVALSPDGRWLVVNVEQGWSKTEVYLKDRKADGPFVTVIENVEAIHDPVIRNDTLYLRTNNGAPRYRVVKVDPSTPSPLNWREIIPEGEDVLDNFAVVGDRLVGLYMRNASSRLRIFDLDGKMLHEVQLPTLGTIEGLGAEWDGKEIFYGFLSFTVPPSVFHFDLKTLKTRLWQRVEADIDADAYEVKQVRYPSKDGTPITMFLAHRKGIKLDGTNPTYLTGYGGFNISETPFFGASLFLFLERGGVVAVPNLRGGGEYGEDWHKAGMLDKKQNVFDDFIAAAEWLIANKYTSPKRLVIQGGSNGGLLIGAAVTQRPDLFRAAVCQVPLLDMLRYHHFRIAKLWIPEYGDPDDPKAFAWLRGYSPYHRVKEGTAYPAMLFTAAESDTRVDAMHARKMAARLQAATAGKGPILLRLETKAGHGAGKPRAKVLEEMTDTWSFLFWQLGVDPEKAGAP